MDRESVQKWEEDFGTKFTSLRFKYPLTREPDSEDLYFYSAKNIAEPVAHERVVLIREPSHEAFMEYEGIEDRAPPKKGDKDMRGCHRFRIVRSVAQGHEFYEGASGAPILAGDGYVVSMVRGGDGGETLWGTPLASVCAGFLPD